MNHLPPPHARLAALMCCAAAAFTPSLVQAQSHQTTAIAPPFHLSANGEWVIDHRARLAWPRCAEGMQWDGQNCGGAALLFSYKQAQAHATQRNQTENQRWRLPRVNEFKRLLDRNAKPAGLNPQLFPNAVRDWHWTGTAVINAQRLNSYNYSQVQKSDNLSSLSAQQAWAVNTETLQAVPDMGKSHGLLLRLVRPATAEELETVSSP